MDILLESKRLRLRRFTASDAEDLYRLDNDAEVMKFINGGAHTPRDVIERVIVPRFAARDERHPVLGFHAAELITTGEFAGWFSFRLSGEHSVDAILGFRLKRKCQGLGYATEGAHALVDHGFGCTNVERVIATTYEKNTASQRVLEKLGMKLVRRFRLTPEDIARSDTHHVSSLEPWDGSDVEYVVSRSEWVKPQGR